MKTGEGDRIYEIIRGRRGRDQAISSYQICLALGWPPARERAVRQIISDESMLWPGLLVCSVAGAGFFCATTCEEAFACETWLRESRDRAQGKLDAFTAQCRKLGLRLGGGEPFAGGVREGIAKIIATKDFLEPNNH